MEKIIERAKPSLNFVEQLQNQIQLCREALSTSNLPLLRRVETLEALLWAKLKDDKQYLEKIKKLNELFEKQIKSLNLNIYRDMRKKVFYQKQKAREQFKAIMIFIDKKNLLPIGEENE